MHDNLKDRSDKLLHPREIFAILARRKWLLIIPIILATAVAYGGSYLLTPRYQSSTIIWIDRPSSVSRELMGLLGASRETPEEQMARIAALKHEVTSQNYLVQLIQDLNLDQDPEISREAAKIRSGNQDVPLEQIKQQLLMNRLRNQISLSAIGADHVRLTVESEDPFDARDKVMKLTEILEREKARYEMERILDNQSFADLQLKKTEADFQTAQDSLTAAQLRLQRTQLPASISSDANRREIQSDIDKTEQEIIEQRNELESIREQMANLNIESPRANFGRAIVNLRADIDGQVSTYANMVEKYAWNDQEVINLNIRMADNTRELERLIDNAVSEDYSSYPENQQDLIARYFFIREDIDILNSRSKQLKLALERLEQRIAAVPDLMAQVDEMKGKVEEARRYRNAFRSEEATVEILSQRMTERTRYRIIEPAKVPLASHWPNRIKLGLLGIVLGLLLGGGGVVLVELLDSSFRKVEDIEEFCGMKVLATVPRSDQLKTVR